ncbi:hypothetical protein J7400_20600 [Shimia sp. R9_2]|uniref:hypothetical protein n=1 Tax=Shimia sp. R9_2 TaxID=2821112 RepID=UPI001AD99BB0|nr:hypothetical protein [Shimia sp. R9_2]MBO9399082.1 hypothetical protein [Shimia sp. R9_2]
MSFELINGILLHFSALMQNHDRNEQWLSSGTPIWPDLKHEFRPNCKAEIFGSVTLSNGRCRFEGMRCDDAWPLERFELIVMDRKRRIEGRHHAPLA